MVEDISGGTGANLGGKFSTNFGNNRLGTGSDSKTTMNVGGRVLTVESLEQQLKN